MNSFSTNNRRNLSLDDAERFDSELNSPLCYFLSQAYTVSITIIVLSRLHKHVAENDINNISRCIHYRHFISKNQVSGLACINHKVMPH